MIQLNLLPDVKQQLIHTQRVRASVISFSILIGIVSLAIVGLIFLWMIGQQAREILLDNSIKDQSQKLSKVEAIDNAVTIQNQLRVIGGLHDSKTSMSRVFPMLVTINPPAPNSINISSMTINTDEKRLIIEANSEGGYPALETFRKTIDATKITYKESGSDDLKTTPLASEISDSDRSLKDTSGGKHTLRFTLSFLYDEHLFASNVKELRIVGPNTTNATDSFVGVPSTLFTSDPVNNGGKR